MRYSGNSPAKATIQVQVWIHFPKKFFASVFVNLTITFTYLSGTILAVCPPGPNPQITLGFSSAPTTKLLIATGVGKHNQTKNISILNNFFMEKIRSTIRHELMVPNGIMLRIPIKKERPFKFYLIRKYKEGKYKDSAPPVNRAAKPPVPPPVNRASKPTNPSPSSPSSPSLTEETEINYSESETGSTQSENVSELIRAEDLYEAFASDENINKNLDPTPPQSSVIPPLRSHTSLSTSLNAPKVLPEDEEVSPVTETSLAMKPNIPGEEKTLCVVEEDEEDKLIERRIRNLSNPDTSLHEHQTLPPSNQPNQPPPVNRNTKPPPVNRNTKPNNP